MEFKELGKSGVKISAIGLGTWQWGSREWGWGRGYGRKDALDAFQKALELGINFVDTAELYGSGRSERLIGEALQHHRDEVVIATKVSPWHLTPGRLLRSAERSARRLGVDAIDLYQIHRPNPILPIRNVMKSMAKLVKVGKVRLIGISNFSLAGTKHAQEALAPLELASNQVKYNLIHRKVEADLLPYAQNSNLTIIPYSPLAYSILTGKYGAESKPTTLVQAATPLFSHRNLARLSKLRDSLGSVAKAHNKTPAQVALNWLISKPNVVAIPGIKRAHHVTDAAGATGWRLSENEITSLESISTGTQIDSLSGITNILKALTHEIFPRKSRLET